jgi:DNA-directed RNA polymerase subunit alpha
LSGVAITSIKIKGVDHEFSAIPGVKEDVIAIILNLKKVRIKMLSDEPQTIELNIKGIKEVTAGDITVPGQVEILNPELYIASLGSKTAELSIEMKIEKGLGYVPKEILEKERTEIGHIALDAIFSPIRRVNYEVENMRVGDRTDFNKLKIFVETDGTITPKEALEESILIMIGQLKAIVGFKEPEIVIKETKEEATDDSKESDAEFLKTRIETLDLSARTINALSNGNIRTVGGLARKKEEDILDLEGLGSKGLSEIKKVLGEHGIELK